MILCQSCKGSISAWLALWLLSGVAGAQESNRWNQIAGSETTKRTGAALLMAEDLGQQLLIGGDSQGRGQVRVLSAPTAGWQNLTAEPELRGGFHPYYQTVYDPAQSRVYTIFMGTVYSLDLKPSGSEPVKWVERGKPAELVGLSWTSAAIDPVGRRIVVVGSDKQAENLGWTRTALLNLETQQWSTLPVPDQQVVRQHQAMVAAREAMIALVGQLRLAWYRSPAGGGSPQERAALSELCQSLKQRPVLIGYVEKFASLLRQIESTKLLSALQTARAMQRTIELDSERQYPVPVSRRNSPLVWDATNQVFVLFGGDHEDYQMNDTWVLDLKQQAWRNAQPQLAPSPRAGHALVYLPKLSRLALYEGYTASSSADYRSRPWQLVEPRQLWTYDVKANHWELIHAWESSPRAAASEQKELPPSAGQFYGYSGQWFNPPALAVEETGRLILHAATGKESSGDWSLKLDPQQRNPALREKLGQPPQSRQYRSGKYLAAYGETDEPAPQTKLTQLPENRWQALPAAPRNMAVGCRQRDWSTSVWDEANDQILLWGGGHVVRSASTVLHYSPVSGRMVEGYDADEPYGYNGGGGFGSSLWNRPWVPTHGYNLYAYDPRAKLLVTATGACYDPQRMDWLRAEPATRPFQFHWSSTVLETTPHGVVAWGKAENGSRIGLWLFDRETGWQDLKPQGKLFQPYCDSDGIVYDSKRDRLILSWGGGYAKQGDGSLTTYDFATHKVEKLLPAQSELGQFGKAREMAYVAHDDCILFGSEAKAKPNGDLDEDGDEGSDEGSDEKATVLYDCAKNRYQLLDAGEVLYGHSTGWMYDGKRKLVYVFNRSGAAYALRLNLPQASLLNQAGAAK